MVWKVFGLLSALEIRFCIARRRDLYVKNSEGH